MAVMRKLLGLLVVGVSLVVAPGAFAQAMDREMSVQFSRYDQLIDRVMKQNEQLMGDIRQLQRENLMMKKTVDESQNRTQMMADEFQKIENLTVNNLSAGQKQLAEQVRRLQVDKPWGDATRDCTELNVKHQQISVKMSPDGKRSVKFLCYDGRVLHLGTEVHDLGQ